MTIRILLTTTSYQDTPGKHQQLLDLQGWEVVRARGPLNEAEMLSLTGELDGFLCGDDAITQAVIDKSLPRLKWISKYGIGLDKIDVDYATSKGIPIGFCPGVNHTTVAEHSFGLLISLTKKDCRNRASHLVKANGSDSPVPRFVARRLALSAWDALAKRLFAAVPRSE